MAGMRLLKAGFRSNKLVTLLGLGLALIYIVPEMTESTHGLRTASYGDTKSRSAILIPLPTRKPAGLPVLKQPQQFDVVSLKGALSEFDFDLDTIRYGQPVPRYYVDQIPVDILDMANIEDRKNTFLSVVLPLILSTNEKILSQRERLLTAIDRVKAGEILSDTDKTWLKNLADRYREEPENLDALLVKVDAIPVSLALAQAVEESGWGTSRFAREGNALFGQRVWSAGKGIVPKERAEGETYEVKAFNSLADSVDAYIHNLNAHPAYELFRSERVRRKPDAGNELTGYKLTETLIVYSERGEEYVEALKALIQSNRFDQFENARLVPEQLAGNRI